MFSVGRMYLARKATPPPDSVPPCQLVHAGRHWWIHGIANFALTIRTSLSSYCCLASFNELFQPNRVDCNPLKSIILFIWIQLSDWIGIGSTVVSYSLSIIQQLYTINLRRFDKWSTPKCHILYCNHSIAEYATKTWAAWQYPPRIAKTTPG